MNLWTTADGRTFPIEMMSDEHLNNSVLLLKRRGYITSAEAGPHPNNGNYDDAVAWASKPAHPMLDALAMERLRRIEEGVVFSAADAEEAQDRYLRQRQPRFRQQPTRLSSGHHHDPDDYDHDSPDHSYNPW